MNREYLGSTIKKGSFLRRNFKVGVFEIGKEAIEEVDAFLRELNFPTTPLGFMTHITLLEVLLNK